MTEIEKGIPLNRDRIRIHQKPSKNLVKSIVLITTGQPSCNPRIVKEANALTQAGNDVTVLYCFFIDWAEREDKKLLKNVNWKYRLIGGSPFENNNTYFFTRLRFKISRILHSYLGNSFLLAERSQARCYDELLKAAKRIKADWYIGHNLGALPIAAKAAKFNHAKAGFDFEDYHRGEHDSSAHSIINRNIFLENKYLPQLDYCSTASDLITSATRQNHPHFKGKIFTIDNCFSLAQQMPFRMKDEEDKTLQLLWFSQTIGSNRGLEDVLDALIIMNDPFIHLTLVGRLDASIEQIIKSKGGILLNTIHFKGIISPDDIPALASRMDIGLALETGHNENREISLTNKIFTYLLAGNAIILSNTKMQMQFNAQYKIGEMYDSGNINRLIEKIQFYQHRENLNTQRKYNYDLARNELNWEKESEKLIQIIENYL